MKDFLVDIIKRFLAKTPKFFKYIKWLSITTAIVTGLPAFLESAGLDLGNAFDAVANKVVSIAALVSAFIAQLTTTIDEQDKLDFK